MTACNINGNVLDANDSDTNPADSSSGDADADSDADADTDTDADADTGTDPSATCTSGGQTYLAGSVIPAGDGCNSCKCMVDAQGVAAFQCTNTACPTQCGTIQETECTTNPECRPIFGSIIDPATSCPGTSQFAGCMSVEMGCDTVITYARNGNECWQFGSACLPIQTEWDFTGYDGQTVCGDRFNTTPVCSDIDTDSDTGTDTASDDTDPTGNCEYNGHIYQIGETFPHVDGCNTCSCNETASGDGIVGCTYMDCDACRMRSEAECTAANGCTPIMGHLLDPNQRCMGEPIFAGCYPAGMGCNEAITYAAANGQCWMFSDSCIPQQVIWEETGGDMATVCGTADIPEDRCTVDTDPVSCDFLSSDCCSENCVCPQPDGSQCVPTHFTAEGVQMGKCKGIGSPTQGTCWSRIECETHSFCEGARICGCESLCVAADAQGKCVDASAGECDAANNSTDCPTGYHCVEMGDEGDICLHNPENLQCWQDADCGANAVCQGQFICGSKVWCLSEPGTCAHP